MNANASRMLVVVAMLAAVPVQAQSVRGRLIDHVSHDGLRGGTVAAVASNGQVVVEAVTDSTGGFQLSLPEPGRFRLRAERSGYRTAQSAELRLTRSDSLDVEFRLAARVVLLEPLVVHGGPRRSARLRGFYQRLDRNTGFGRFITRSAIERRHPVRTSDLLLTVPGVQVVPGQHGRPGAVLLRGCTARLYMDGVRIRSPGVTVDELVHPADVEGIEVYSSSLEVPVEFQSLDNSCGAVLIWTRID